RPYLPADLVAQLHAALDAQQAGIAMAVTVDAQQLRSPQPTFALLRTSLADDLAARLAAGDRKVRAWYARHKTVEVEFRDERAFYNANSWQELAALARR
ncbi:molybdenum cofactor guanylyltransferase MobA, partial [Burkholderia cenocepacia]|nr:molybdenum cofactor guanylyltransferase MobA [Burkholderia cenocepacia]